jgi:hypothetical protein
MHACLPSEPPKELRNAFWGAIGAYNDWHPRQPEPEVSLHQQPTAISSICDSVRKHDGPMPNSLWLHLEMVTRGSEQLPEDRSYRSGARFLGRLIKVRKVLFDRLSRVD